MPVTSHRQTINYAKKSDDPMKRRLADIALEAEIRADSFRSRERREHRDAIEAGRLCRRQAAEISRLERECDSQRRQKEAAQARYRRLLAMVTGSPDSFEEEECPLADSAAQKKIRQLEAELDQEKAAHAQTRNERDQAKAALAQFQKEIEQKDLLIDHLKIKLDRQMHQNSENCSLPSSFDVCTRSKAARKEEQEEPGSKTGPEISQAKIRKPISSRKPSGRKRGGQPDHPAHTKKLSDTPDKVVDRVVSEIPWGASPVRDENGAILYYAAQVTSMQVETIVTEIRYHLDTTAQKPDGKEMNVFRVCPSVYAPEFRAFCVFLLVFARIPYARLVQVLQSMTKGQICPSQGTIAKWARQIAQQTAGENEKILERILQSDVIHVDETGVKVSGKQHWLHTLTTENDVYYVLTRSRGDKEDGPVGILNKSGYSGVAVHDHWAAYLTLCLIHAECNVHIERYMRNGAAYDKYEECTEMLEFFAQLREMKKADLEQGRTGGARPEDYQEAREKMIDICTRGMKKWEEQMEKGDPEVMKKFTPPCYNAFKRMKKDPEPYLRFIELYDVPFGNNLAERRIGAFKSKMKVSRQFITVEGGKAMADLMSYIETYKDADLLELLTELVQSDGF